MVMTARIDLLHAIFTATVVYCQTDYLSVLCLQCFDAVGWAATYCLLLQ